MSTMNDTNKVSNGLSIVVPFLNEKEGIEICCTTLDEYAKELDFPIEVIFVDDGSTDNSIELIRKYQFQHVKAVEVLSLSKNYGSHAAIRAGVSRASFDICTWMGSDLQEPKEFLVHSYAKIQEGYDAVYVEKKSIKVSKANRGFSRIYSTLMQKYAVKNYSSGGISNIVFNRKIIDFLKLEFLLIL